MPTTADYLNDLVAQKNSLAETLANNGVEVGEDETFSTLVPKVSESLDDAMRYKKLAEAIETREHVSPKFEYNHFIPFDYTDDTVTDWHSQIFAGVSNLQRLSLPECTIISAPGAFRYSGVTSIDLPKLETIAYTERNTCLRVDNVFDNCANLTSISLPNLTRIKGFNIFSNCKNLTTIDLPNLETLEDFAAYAFANNTKLTDVNLPKVTFTNTSTGNNGDTGNGVGWQNYRSFFEGCTALTHISLPKALGIPYYCFFGCSSLSSVYAPLVRVMGLGPFANCTALTELDLPSCTRIVSVGTAKNLTKLTLSSSGDPINLESSAVSNCASLKTIILDGPLTSNLNFKNNPLDLDTAKRIINCLENYAGTENEYVYKVTFSSTTLSLLDAEGATAPGGLTWVNYADTKGWSI